MRRFVSAIVGAAVLAAAAGVALAHGPGGRGAGFGPGWMGMGMGRMGSQMMGAPGAGPAAGGCPGSGGAATAEPQAAITEEKAKALAQEYADTYLKGYAVEKVLPFTGHHMTMYSVELRGPDDELRVLHINPFGNVMPFGGPWRRGA